MAAGGETGLDVPVGHVATSSFVTVTRDERLDAVTAEMGARGLPSVVVVDDGMRPVGIVSERDLVRFLATILRGEAMLVGTAGDLMTSPVMTAHRDQPVDAVAELMRSHRIRSVPVVDDDGRITKVVRFTDVLRHTAASLANRRDELEALVEARTAELRDAHEALKVLARTDKLTQLGNRRAMEIALADAHARAVRYHRPYSVVLSDVDHFKRFNDAYGHQAGDAVLREVAAIFKLGLRTVDGAFRYGGEELLAILPETPLDGARIVAERLRRAVASLRLSHGGQHLGGITSSFGVATFDPDHGPEGWEYLVRQADEALYAAKEAGRDRVVLAEQTTTVTI